MCVCTIRIGRHGLIACEDAGAQHLFLTLRVVRRQLRSSLQASVGIGILPLLKMTHTCCVLGFRKSVRGLLESALIRCFMRCRLNSPCKGLVGSIQIASFQSPLADIVIGSTHECLDLLECLYDFGVFPYTTGDLHQLGLRPNEVSLRSQFLGTFKSMVYACSYRSLARGNWKPEILGKSRPHLDALLFGDIELPLCQRHQELRQQCGPRTVALVPSATLAHCIAECDIHAVGSYHEYILSMCIRGLWHVFSVLSGHDDGRGAALESSCYLLENTPDGSNPSSRCDLACDGYARQDGCAGGRRENSKTHCNTRAGPIFGYRHIVKIHMDIKAFQRTRWPTTR